MTYREKLIDRVENMKTLYRNADIVLIDVLRTQIERIIDEIMVTSSMELPEPIVDIWEEEGKVVIAIWADIGDSVHGYNRVDLLSPLSRRSDVG
jgi:hypothetical protein